MKHNIILCFFILATSAGLSAQNAPALPNLDGWWVVVGTQKDDIGSITTWMSEWLVKGNSLTAAYKGILAQTSMSNPNWQIRSFRSSGGTVYFEIVQNMSGMISQLNITLTEMDGNAIRGQYIRLDDYGFYRQQYRGAIELRKIEMNVDPVLVAGLLGKWRNNGLQTFDISNEKTTFNDLLSIEQIKEGGILLKSKSRDANNIEVTSEFLLIYLRRVSGQIKMVIYSPKGECMNPGCGYLLEYTFTSGSPAAGLMQGTWEGIFANQILFRGQGTSTYKKLP